MLSSNYVGWNANTERDPHWASVVLLVQPMQADATTTFTDLSPVGRTITTVGNAQVDSAIQFFDKNTILLDGTGDYLTVPNASDISFANTTEKTIEAIIRVNTGSRINTILNKRDAASAEEFSFYVDAANKLTFVAFNGGAAIITIVGTTTISTATDYHVATSRRSGSSNYYEMWLNGVLEGSADSISNPSSNTGVLYIGRDGFNTGRDFNGWLGGVRYTNACRYFSVNGAHKRAVAPWPLH